ncbi:ABC transporter permease [Paenarthrobacter sp. YJN-5]|uniref:ABC transporter permease n=1 Tax=Paenarthrobacter sp. YJN-5 TaxID=2735316 RepID=UPI0018781EFB|nr:ABC transporter permease [Paenarthrobacter sp. YJN-5]QOT18553.1 ABC transporter permease [Paenarthrobacter sp. YJN-5]
MTTIRYSAQRQPLFSRTLRSFATPGGAIYLLLLALLIILTFYNPSLAEPDQMTRFIGRSVPIAVVAIGQYFVIVAGEFDLSMGAVISAQVVLAGNLIGQEPSRIPQVMVLMMVLGTVVGIVNGVLTSLLKVPSFITTLGTALVLSGLTFYFTGGAPSGNPADAFRAIGRGGLQNVPLIGFVPYSVLVLLFVAIGAAWLMKKPFGRMLIAVGDNPATTALAGASPWWIRTKAFILSSTAATVAAVLMVGYAGASPVVGQGYEFTAITAVVLGGVALGGGRGAVLSAVAGAYVLETLVSILNFAGIQSTWRPSVQGAIIILALGIPLLRMKRPAWLTKRPVNRNTPDDQ